MSSRFQRSSSKRSSWLDDMDRFIADIYEEDLFHPIELMEVQACYYSIANEPSEWIFDLLVVGYEEQTPMCELFGKQEIRSTSIQDAITYLHSTRLSGLQIIKSACSDDLRHFKCLPGQVQPCDGINCDIHKWILIILLRKAWGLTIPDCKVLCAELWKNPPVPPNWRYLRPPELVGTAYLRRCLQLASAKWDLLTMQQDGQQSDGQGLFGKRNIFRIFYINDLNRTEAELAALDIIFFQEATYAGAKKVLLVSSGSFCALHKEPLEFPHDHMLGRNPDYGDSHSPWSSQLLRLLLTIVSGMRQQRRYLLKDLEERFESFSNSECSWTPMRCQLAGLSVVKTWLHTGNICCAANDQTISHLIDQLDSTPGLTASKIDKEAVSELRFMSQDMKNLRISLEQMEVEFQELRERVRDELSVKQSLMINLLYTIIGAALSLFLLSMPIGGSGARWSGAKDIPGASAKELPTIATFLSGAFNYLGNISYASVYEILGILKLCLPGVIFALLFIGTLEGRPLQLLYWFISSYYHDMPYFSVS